MLQRTNRYLGPMIDANRSDLAQFEARNCFVAEEKIDGNWGELRANDSQVLSRTGIPFNDTGLEKLNLKRLGETILICEVERQTEAAIKRNHEFGYVRFWLFDILMCKGHDLSQYDTKSRGEILREIVWSVLPSDVQLRMPCVAQARSGFIKFYDHIVKNGGEGVVLKLQKAQYKSQRSDGKTSDWIRIKPHRSVDYVIIGPAKTAGGDLTAQLGLYIDGKLEPIIKYQLIPGLCMKEGVLMGLVEGVLQPIVGMIIELRGRELLSSGALRNGQMKCYRFDKYPQDCTGVVEYEEL